MKKIISYISILTLCLLLLGCNAEAKTEVSSSQIEKNYDVTLMKKLGEWVNTTQPGTAGTSLKAFAAAKDVLAWAKDNISDKETVKATVKEFLVNCEYKDEALDALHSVEYVFEKVADGTAADLMASAGFKTEDFKIDQKTAENIRMLFDALEEYLTEIEKTE